MIKRYMVFAGDYHYPSGGFDDYKGSFNDEEEAITFADSLSYDWKQVIDTYEGCDIYIYKIDVGI